MSEENSFGEIGKIFGTNAEAAKKIENEDVETGETGGFLNFEEEETPNAAAAGEEFSAFDAFYKENAAETGGEKRADEGEEIPAVASGLGDLGVSNPTEGEEKLSPEETQEIIRKAERLAVERNVRKQELKEEPVAEGGEQLKMLSEEFERSVNKYFDKIEYVNGFSIQKQRIEYIFDQINDYILKKNDANRAVEGFVLLKEANQLMDGIFNENEKALTDELNKLEADFDKISDRWVKEIKNPGAVSREKKEEFKDLTEKAELILSKLRNKKKDLDEVKFEMVEILARINSLIDEIINEETEREGKDALLKLPEKERQGIIRGIVNAGYKIKEYKARLFAGVLNSGAELVLGGDGRKLKLARKFNTERWLNSRKNLIRELGEEEGERAFKEELEENRALREIREDNIKEKEDAKFYKFLKNFGKVYEKEATRAEKRRTQARMGAFQKFSGIGALSGNILKSGRVVYDFYNLSSNVLNVFNPFKCFTAAALFTGRALEATKETRFSNIELKSKTRIGEDDYDKIYSGDEFEQNDEDYQKAYYEAWRVHEEAEKAKEEELSAKGIYPLTATVKEKELKTSDLENASGKFIHLDLLKRLGNGKEVYRNTLMEMIRQTTEEMSQETKEEKKEELQARINALTNLDEVSNLNLDNFKNNPNFKILTKEEQLILSDFLKGDEIYASNGMDAVRKIIAAGIRERVKFIARHLQAIALDEKLTSRQKRMKQEFYYKTFESFLKDMDRIVDQTGAVDALSYTFRTGEKIAKTASVLMIFDTIYRMKLHFLPGEHYVENGLPPEVGEKEKGGFIEGLKKRFLGEKEAPLERGAPSERIPEETPTPKTEAPSVIEELDKEILKDLDEEILGNKKEEKRSNRFLEMISPASAYGAEPFKTFKDAFDGLKDEERENFKKTYLDLKNIFNVDKTGKKTRIVEQIYSENGGGERGKEAVKAEIFRVMKLKGQLRKETLDVLPSKAGGVAESPKTLKFKITGEKWTAEKANSNFDNWMKEWKEKGRTNPYYARIYTMLNVVENRKIALRILQGENKYNEQIGIKALEDWIKDKSGKFSPSIYEPKTQATPSVEGTMKPELAPTPKVIPSPQGTVRPATMPPAPESAPSAQGTRVSEAPKVPAALSEIAPPPAPSGSVEKILAVPEAPVKIKAEIKEGGNVWSSIFSLIGKGEGKISADQFNEAWNNPKSGAVVGGKFMRIKDINLTHEHDEVVFISAKDGESARFEAVDYKGDKYKMGHMEILPKPAEKAVFGAVRDDEVKFSRPGDVLGKGRGEISEDGLTKAERIFGAGAAVKSEESAPFVPAYQPESVSQFDAYEKIIKAAGINGDKIKIEDVRDVAGVLGYEINGEGEPKSLSPEFIAKFAEKPEIFKEINSEGKLVWSKDRLKFLDNNDITIDKIGNIFAVHDIVNRNLDRDFNIETIYRNFYSDDVNISEWEDNGIKILKNNGGEFYVSRSGNVLLGTGGGLTLESPIVPGTYVSKNINLNEFTTSSLDKSSEGILLQYGREKALFGGLIKEKQVFLGKDLPDIKIKKILGSEKISEILDKKWPDNFSQRRSAENVREFFMDQINFLETKLPSGDFKTDLETMNSGAFLSKYAGELTERKIMTK